MSELSAAHREKLIVDLKAVLADAEALLASTAQDASASAVELRAKVQGTLKRARASLLEVQGSALDKAKAAAKVTDVYVHDNPWSSVSVAAGVGLLVGLLIGRR